MCSLYENPAEYSSCSERQMLENVKRIIRHVVYYFEEYLDAIGVEPSAEDDERFGFILTNFELVRGLFLFGTSHLMKTCSQMGGRLTWKRKKGTARMKHDLLNGGISLRCCTIRISALWRMNND